MKTFVLINTLALATAFADFAESDLLAAKTKDISQPTQVQQSAPATVQPLVLTSGNYPTNKGWYLYADALYWHADEGDQDWAFKDNTLKTTDAGTGNINEGPLKSLRFKWDWAFRVGLGMNLAHDNWDTYIQYTRFVTENTNRAGAIEGQELVSAINNNIMGPNVSGKISWRIDYSIFNAEIARSFFVSKKICLKPHGGIIGGWINQKIHQKYFAGTLFDVLPNLTSFERAKNDFWGIGVTGGMNSTWRLGTVHKNIFNLLGDFAGALMYGHFDLAHRQWQTTPAGVNLKEVEHDIDRHLAVPMIQAMLGLSWNRPFNSDQCFVGIKIGYEFQFWFRQFQQFTNVDLAANVTNVKYNLSPQDLVIQGLTVDVRFDF